MKKIIISFIIAVIILIWILDEINKKSDKYLYGNSYRQNKIANCIRLHKYGISGKGVTIGVLGAGFYTQHSVFENMNLVKEYDFITKKKTTINFDHIKGMDHGTCVLSVLGGYKENELIGIAYDANFILAKTDISTKRLFEEEIIAAKGSRWLYENGSNIITTSLSFNKFDNADYYTPDQMDGNTSLISRTADSLFNEGAVYISSAGNKYAESWHIIETPGDGKNVLTVGSIDIKLNHSWFSSCGPTVDGRIKPDVVTLGERVWTAHYLPKVQPDFWWSHGTSVSTPIAAGIAALVLSAHPDLTPRQIIEAIKMTSSKSEEPDSIFGWGIPDAERAVSYFGPAFSNTPVLAVSEDNIEINTYIISSYGLVKESVKLHLLNNHGEKDTVYIMTEISNDYYSQTLAVNSPEDRFEFYFSAGDSTGRQTKYPAGILGDFFTIDSISIANGEWNASLINNNF